MTLKADHYIYHLYGVYVSLPSMFIDVLIDLFRMVVKLFSFYNHPPINYLEKNRPVHV